MGEPYERELERVRRARGNFEASQDEVEKRKQEYFTAVRTLHEAGMPLREIATALGLSHQRVHQMVDEATGKKGAALRRKTARAARQSGLALLIVAFAASGVFLLRPELSPLSEPDDEVSRVSAAPSPTPRVPDRSKKRTAPELGTESCAREIFIWQDKFGKKGRAPTLTFEPHTCEVTKFRVRGGEARLKRQIRDMRITIRGRA